jgi:hypothetical protein
MPENARRESGPVNLLLVALLGVLVGSIGGYMVGQHGPIAVTADSGVAPPCPFELSAADEYIIAGFSCPAPACQDPLHSCHCDMAHEIKTKIKQELGQGKDGAAIREELIQRYGAQLRKAT